MLWSAKLCYRLGEALVLLSVMASAASAQTAVTASRDAAMSAVSPEYDSYVRQVMDSWAVPGLAWGAIGSQGQQLAQAYGYADISRNRPVTTATLFPIASCTKAFTACLCAMLVQDGKLTFNQPVKDILPEFQLANPYATDHVNLRDLLSQRTGLPRHDALWFTNVTNPADVLSRAAWLDPALDFRQAFCYSSQNYVLAAAVCERAAGQTWDELVRQRIFLPLGMQASCLSLNEMRQAADYALSYQASGSHTGGGWETLSPLELPALRPAGGVVSNVEDMLRWVRFQLESGQVDGNSVLNPALFTSMHNQQAVVPLPASADNPSPMGYGMGWYVSCQRGHYAVMHDGVLYGYSAYIILYPLEHVGCVVLCNARLSPAPQLVAAYISDSLLGLAPVDLNQQLVAQRDAQAASTAAPASPEAGTALAAERQLAAYTGTYTHPAYGQFEVILDGTGGLGWQLGRLGGKLEPAGGEKFKLRLNRESLSTLVAGLDGGMLSFAVNADGSATSVDVPLEPLLPPLAFDRVSTQATE